MTASSTLSSADLTLTPLPTPIPNPSANRVALFTQLYSLKGFLSALIKLDNMDSDNDLKPVAGSEVLWARPFILGHYYAYGWPEVIGVDMMGAKYTTTGNVMKSQGGGELGDADLANGNAVLQFLGAQLTETIEKAVSISSNLVTDVPDPADPTFSLTLTPSMGDIGGNFIHTDDSLLNFKGIIYQKGSRAGAYGWWLTKQPSIIDYTGESGSVRVFGQQ